MNRLKAFFDHGEHRPVIKWNHYFDIYDRHFYQFVGKPVTFLEIGVCEGGSLQLWKDYFGPEARILGLDINPECKKLEEDQIHIFIGDQADKDFLRQTFSSETLSVVLDDGGHTMTQQINSFEALFPILAPGGIYMVEDTHTSYRHEWGGGLKRKGTFMEYCKDLIDKLHGFYYKAVTDETLWIPSITFYDSVVVIQKALAPNGPPFFVKK